MRYKIYEYLLNGSLRETPYEITNLSVRSILMQYGFTGTQYDTYYAISRISDNEHIVKYMYLANPQWKLVEIKDDTGKSNNGG